jgi:hypothetical protein
MHYIHTHNKHFLKKKKKLRSGLRAHHQAATTAGLTTKLPPLESPPVQAATPTPSCRHWAHHQTSRHPPTSGDNAGHHAPDPTSHESDPSSHALSVREEPAGRCRRVALPLVRERKGGRAPSPFAVVAIHQ